MPAAGRKREREGLIRLHDILESILAQTRVYAMSRAIARGLASDVHRSATQHGTGIHCLNHCSSSTAVQGVS